MQQKRDGGEWRFVRFAVLFSAVVCCCVAQEEGTPPEDPIPLECRCGKGPGLAVKHILQTVVIKDGSCTKHYACTTNIMRSKTQSHLCTGVLISPNEVVVPATCVSDVVPSAERFPLVRIGTFHLYGENEAEAPQVLSTCKQRIPAAFTGNPADGLNIALLTLNDTVAIDKHNISIPTIVPMEQSIGRLLESVGWFKATELGAPGTALQVAPNLAWVEKEECSKTYGDLAHGMVCANSSAARTINEWDPGAPLLSCLEIGGHLVGLASHKKEPCQNCPYVYTHLSYFEEWIKGNGPIASKIAENPERLMHPKEEWCQW